MKRLLYPEAEFYLGLLTTVSVVFLMPMLITMEVCNTWAFLGYIYLPPGIGMIFHALYREEKERG